MMQEQKQRSFYDDYEDDCIELWDAIEKLQGEVARLEKDNKRMKAVVAQLMLKNGIIYKEATT